MGDDIQATLAELAAKGAEVARDVPDQGWGLLAAIRLPDGSPEWLRSLAVAALDGRLDTARLRALPAEEALAQLKELPGVGGFSAELVLLRGAGAPDEVPRHEPRLARAVARAYDRPAPPSADELARISGSWRPYRTWTTLLLRTYLEDETGEIAGRRPAGRILAGGLSRARGLAGRRRGPR